MTSATYNLNAIKVAVAKLGAAAFTVSALEGGFAMGLTSVDMLAVVQSVTSNHFYKTMASKQNPGVWQDVYRVPASGGMAYVKFTLAATNPKVVISFKEL